MVDYHALYLKLAGAQADAIDVLQDTTEKLIRVHREVEEAIMNTPELQILRTDSDQKDTE
ncbi:hypothetical protein LJC07_00765 [Christensenellaceae bacterium OttesenSCG-928-L17]|nr:hypothetical protein [Christensenellaceae bacterium OttesenSCG-928-L17]